MTNARAGHSIHLMHCNALLKAQTISTLAIIGFQMIRMTYAKRSQ